MKTRHIFTAALLIILAAGAYRAARGADAPEIAAKAETVVLDERFQVERAPGSIDGYIIIPRGYVFFHRVVARVDCGGAIEFLLTLEYKHNRMLNTGISEPAEIGGPYEWTAPCTPGREVEIDLSDWITKSLRPGNDMVGGDSLRVSLEGMFVDFLAVVLEYRAALHRGEQGDPGAQGIPGVDGKSIVGPEGPEGPEGKRGAIGVPGQCDCKYPEHKHKKG